ncbi:zinc finger protein 1-like [Lolium rigidum]|uniref:zinc finger protein 1-like n=1 Tax=Lolium rigidum TaxID=89674 RepID=UPI001F5E159E|nr:zinc finger protein 1-like [Lolium rigidum]
MSLDEVSRKSPAPPASPPRMDSWARGGRRTKRRGGAGSGSFGGGAESDDEYVALCLVMMARGVRGDADEDFAVVKGVGVAAPRRPHGYECSVCGKVYASYQALGGHKTSHRKPPAPPAQSAPAGGGDEASAGGAVAEARVHRCSLCDRTFPSGQALGGHKRLHYEGGAAAAEALGGGKDKEAAKAKAAALLRDFDLNLPAAASEAESGPPEAKRARTAMLLAAV